MINLRQCNKNLYAISGSHHLAYSVLSGQYQFCWVCMQSTPFNKELTAAEEALLVGIYLLRMGIGILYPYGNKFMSMNTVIKDISCALK